MPRRGDLPLDVPLDELEFAVAQLFEQGEHGAEDVLVAVFAGRAAFRLADDEVVGRFGAFWTTDAESTVFVLEWAWCHIRILVSVLLEDVI